MNNIGVLSLPEKSRLVARDIRDTVMSTGRTEVKNFQPSRQLAELLSGAEYDNIIQGLMRNGCLSMPLFFPTGSMMANGYLPRYSFSARLTQLNAFIADTVTPKDTSDTGIHYSVGDHLLNIFGRVLVIKGDLQTNLCATVFSDPGRIWSNDEVFEQWQWPENRILDETGALRRENRLIIYNTARQLNMKVSGVTNGRITRLIGASTKSVWLEMQYRHLVE